MKRLRLALLALAVCAAGCRTQPPAPAPPLASEVKPFVAPDFAARGIVEVAVTRPDGSSLSEAFRTGLREALQSGLVDRAYSPLDPARVDSMERTSRPPAIPRLRSRVTQIRRASDGGVLISGSASLEGPTSEPAIYRMEVEAYSVPPLPGTEAPDGGRAAGRLFGEVLLSRLPPRAGGSR